MTAAVLFDLYANPVRLNDHAPLAIANHTNEATSFSLLLRSTAEMALPIETSKMPAIILRHFERKGVIATRPPFGIVERYLDQEDPIGESFGLVKSDSHLCSLNSIFCASNETELGDVMPCVPVVFEVLRA